MMVRETLVLALLTTGLSFSRSDLDIYLSISPENILEKSYGSI